MAARHSHPIFLFRRTLLTILSYHMIAIKSVAVKHAVPFLALAQGYFFRYQIKVFSRGFLSNERVYHASGFIMKKRLLKSPII